MAPMAEGLRENSRSQSDSLIRTRPAPSGTSSDGAKPRPASGFARCRRVAIGFPDHRQAVGVGERRAPEQHGVHHAEDGGVRADAEAESDDAGEGELRVLEE